ncbi:hypothetical protein [Streptomyces sp900129855]|uniref:Trans-2-decenoyl-[acyl-carrier-protein] isomerase n=1 Tax=Streptomyces sp. 900129855 TaxID=3155129 RepID=A0ABV2ZKY5_9ACTN
MPVPHPPTVPADRVTWADGEPGAAPGAVMRSETDIARGRWYLDPAGRVCAGALLAAGQGNRPPAGPSGAEPEAPAGRSYRLLDCALTFQGPLPVPGQTLRCETRVEDRAEHAGVPLLSFRSDVRVDGELRLSVRGGQAGLFTERELADAKGVLWTPEKHVARPSGPFRLPPTVCPSTSFTAAQVRAFAQGRPAECFGAGWERAAAHVRSPRLTTARGLLFEEVTAFDPTGGPLGRGYLRARLNLTPDQWFFAGGDPGDPHLPSFLLLEGCLQALAFHQAALGTTVDRDGWRFEPARGERQSVCLRAQATPRSRVLVYEVFVTAVCPGPVPRIRADVLCRVDGVNACAVTGLALGLVQDWPLDDREHTGSAPHGGTAPDPRAAVVDGLALDRRSMLAHARGRYRDALGPEFGALDTPVRALRVPAPPFLFMTRVRALGAAKARLRQGSWVEAEYDVPGGPWLGGHDGADGAPPRPSMAALMEIGLQPCGWLAQYSGCCLGRDADLLFRNLDGRTRALRTEGLAPRRVRTRATLTDWADDGTVLLLFFDVECRADDDADDAEPFFAFTTSFGFFPPSAFEGQTGLPPSEAEQRRRDDPGTRAVDFSGRPEKFFTGPLRLPDSDLLVLDRITGYRPPNGDGPGRIRAEAEIRPDAWFFKAHFFQDPVQPGSLGVEAMYQALQAYAIERDLAAGPRAPRCEPTSADVPLVWRYRGQVVPSHRLVTVELEITAEREDAHGHRLEARGTLWADDTLIYRVEGLAVRITTEAARPTAVTPTAVTPTAVTPTGGHLAEELLDPARDTWLADHCPALTTPSVPMMHVVRMVAEAAERATGRRPGRIRDLTVRRWIVADAPVRYGTAVRRGERGTGVDLLLFPADDGTGGPALVGEPTLVASGTAEPGDPEPAAPLPPLTGARPVAHLPYEGDAPLVFHGPAFHYLRGMRIGDRGASGVIDPRRGSVPTAAHHSGLLDAALHIVPHHALWTWDETLPREVFAYPYRLDTLDLYEPLLGTGPLRVEARLLDSDDLPAGSFVRVGLQLFRRRAMVADIRLTDALVPLGLVGPPDHPARMAFLRDRVYAAGLGVSRTTPLGVTHLTAADAQRADWYPGLVDSLYRLPEQGPDHPLRLARIAVRDHVGRLLRTHPCGIETSPDLNRAWAVGRPREVVRVWVRAEGPSVAVGTLAGPGPFFSNTPN